MDETPLLQIDNLHAEVEDRSILNGVNLDVRPGTVHAIMGPNGSGKSTLAQVLAGRDTYAVTGGSVRYRGMDLLDMAPEERAREGLFLAFQYPQEFPGVSVMNFLRQALSPRDVPALVIFGRNDPFISWRYAERQRETFADADIHVWDDCGHFPHVQHPERTAETVAAFLQTVVGSAG